MQASAGMDPSSMCLPDGSLNATFRTQFMTSPMLGLMCQLTQMDGADAAACTAQEGGGTNQMCRWQAGTCALNTPFLECLAVFMAVDCGCGDMTNSSNPVVQGAESGDFSACAPDTACGAAM
eukprot:SAG22_NODE_797_length_7135_cov_211.841103_3_plen_122_part_00